MAGFLLSSAGNCPLGDSGDGDDSDFGIPPSWLSLSPSCRLSLVRDGYNDDDGVFGIPPLSRRLSPHILPSEAARRRMGRA
ncbi:hypothetical protein BGU95_11250 [Clostridioides difficile]|nr:hypothetical protein BGT97_08870 [Clostridioides difficile]PBG44210.1 hypothetical protein BGU95_11250 [Clostridioides difficile]PBH15950.1 hypothetical protein BGV19_02445 [Clostridioides difficile]PCD11271.1 hypothetical protein V440_17515 [Clostridioides difficile]